MDRSELERYKVRLFEMRAELTNTVNDIETAIRETVVAPGDVSTLPTHPANFDSEGLDRNVALAQNEAQVLEQVEASLERIEAGSFGKCAECGEEIPRERLDALPYTPHCVHCAERQESGAAQGGGEAG